jgi:hypothetical protein
MNRNNRYPLYKYNTGVKGEYTATAAVYTDTTDGDDTVFYAEIVYRSENYSDSCLTGKFPTLGDALISAGYHIRMFDERREEADEPVIKADAVEKFYKDYVGSGEEKPCDEEAPKCDEPRAVYSKTYEAIDRTCSIVIIHIPTKDTYEMHFNYKCNYFKREFTMDNFSSDIAAAVYAGRWMDKYDYYKNQAKLNMPYDEDMI